MTTPSYQVTGLDPVAGCAQCAALARAGFNQRCEAHLRDQLMAELQAEIGELLLCQRCGTLWLPRLLDRLPKQCPKCKNTRWNIPRDEKENTDG